METNPYLICLCSILVVTLYSRAACEGGRAIYVARAWAETFDLGIEVAIGCCHLDKEGWEGGILGLRLSTHVKAGSSRAVCGW